jgi:DNA-directed RNA polymerase III subunit RPC8
MFILSVLKDTIKIEPADFRKPKQEAITDEVNKKYANKVSNLINFYVEFRLCILTVKPKVVQEIGLCISLFDVIEASEGVIHHGDGCSYVKGL